MSRRGRVGRGFCRTPILAACRTVLAHFGQSGGGWRKPSSGPQKGSTTPKRTVGLILTSPPAVSLVSKKKPGRRRRSPGFCSARSSAKRGETALSPKRSRRPLFPKDARASRGTVRPKYRGVSHKIDPSSPADFLRGLDARREPARRSLENAVPCFPPSGDFSLSCSAIAVTA